MEATDEQPVEGMKGEGMELLCLVHVCHPPGTAMCSTQELPQCCQKDFTVTSFSKQSWLHYWSLGSNSTFSFSSLRRGEGGGVAGSSHFGLSGHLSSSWSFPPSPSCITHYYKKDVLSHSWVPRVLGAAWDQGQGSNTYIFIISQSHACTSKIKLSYMKFYIWPYFT